MGSSILTTEKRYGCVVATVNEHAVFEEEDCMRLHCALMDLILEEEGHTEKIVIDFGSVQNISSILMAFMNIWYAQARESELTLRVARLNDEIWGYFVTWKMQKLFTNFACVDHAIFLP